MENTNNDIWSYTEDDKKLEKITTNVPNFPFWERIKDNKYVLNKKIVIKQSSHQIGLGIFAGEKIKKDELIERAPLIQMGWKSNYQFDPQLHNYCWVNASCNCDDCLRHGYSMFMPLGYGGIYNHKDQSNAKANLNYKNLFMDVVAIENILKGEEIFINYGPKYFSKRIKI